MLIARDFVDYLSSWDVCGASASVRHTCETLWSVPMDWKNPWVEPAWFHGWGLMTALINGNSCILGSCTVRIASLPNEGGWGGKPDFTAAPASCDGLLTSLCFVFSLLAKVLILLDARRYVTLLQTHLQPLLVLWGRNIDYEIVFSSIRSPP